MVPIQSVDALIEKIHFFIEHPEQIEKMGRNARKTAEQYTWENYSDNVSKAVAAIVKKHGFGKTEM